MGNDASLPARPIHRLRGTLLPLRKHLEVKKDSYTMPSLDSVIEQALRGSAVPESGAPLKRQLIDYYTRHGLHCDSIGQAVSYIYDNELSEHHDIYGLGESGYFILPAKKAFPKDVLLTTLREHRAHQEDLSGAGFQEFIEQLTRSIQAVHAALGELRQSRRKFDGFKPEPEFPSFAELKEFHECRRKVSHGSFAEAMDSLSEGQRAYQCNHCSSWHKGHPPILDSVPQEAMERRYKRTWRRYHDL